MMYDSGFGSQVAFKGLAGSYQDTDNCDWFLKGFERCGFSGFGYFVLADTKMQHP
jgi:hypothetical protein